jgi:hypothetical protein
VLGGHVLDWWGGSVTCTATAARELARLGHRVTILSPRVGEPGRVARGARLGPGRGRRRARAARDLRRRVIGKARVIVEAMACGRAAYVYDHNGGDGWITRETYERHAADNFAGQSTLEVVDASRLRRDLGEYRPEMGPANRDLAVLHHSAARRGTRTSSWRCSGGSRPEPRPLPTRLPRWPG